MKVLVFHWRVFANILIFKQSSQVLHSTKLENPDVMDKTK